MELRVNDLILAVHSVREKRCMALMTDMTGAADETTKMRHPGSPAQYKVRQTTVE